MSTANDNVFACWLRIMLVCRRNVCAHMLEYMYASVCSWGSWASWHTSTDKYVYSNTYHVHIYVYMYTYIQTHIHTNVCMHVCMYVSLYSPKAHWLAQCRSGDCRAANPPLDLQEWASWWDALDPPSACRANIPVYVCMYVCMFVWSVGMCVSHMRRSACLCPLPVWWRVVKSCSRSKSDGQETIQAGWHVHKRSGFVKENKYGVRACVRIHTKEHVRTHVQRHRVTQCAYAHTHSHITTRDLQKDARAHTHKQHTHVLHAPDQTRGPARNCEWWCRAWCWSLPSPWHPSVKHKA